jgi:hypothetical protein
MSASVELPLALLQSDDYGALNDEQRRNFLARLRYCEEIAEKAVAAAQMQDLDLLDAVDDIELDVLSILSGFGEVDSTVSIYKVHSSWTFECDRRSMAAFVPSAAVDFLRQPPIGLTACAAEVVAWLDRWGRALRTSLDCLTAATSFTAAVTQLIVVDALVSSYVAFAACVRLGGQA